MTINFPHKNLASCPWNHALGYDSEMGSILYNAEMKKMGMSQSDLGRQVGVERSDINKYLRGSNTAVSFERILEMAEAVDLEVDVTIKRKKG